MKYFRNLFLILSLGINNVILMEINGLSTISMLTSNCQLNNKKRDPRIVGGSDTELNEIPFIVSLVRRGGHFCGATIINENWLITAGHCLCNGLNNILKANNIKGILGLHKISDYKKDTEYNSPNQPFQVNFKHIITYPNYKCTKTSNDIALLELEIPIKFNQHIKPACILKSNILHKNHTNQDYAYEDVMATVSGWGWNNENQNIGDRADKLQKATVKVWNNDKCQKTFTESGKKNSISKTQMCAGYESGGIDSCWADSGGPLIIDDNTLIGIVSTGIGCARPGLPGIYTRVDQYIKWIESIIYTKT